MAKQAQFKKEELQEAFTMYCSADNTIPCSRLAAVIRSVGGAPTEEKIRHLCTEFESKGKKTLTLQEVDAIWTKYTFAPVPAEDLRDAFRIFDKDGNGMINAAELRHVLTNLGEKLTDEEVDEMIREADLNGDNQINYAEFVKVMQDGC